MKTCCLTLLFLLGTLGSSFGQIFPTQYGNWQPATNILTPVPASGTLLIDYDFSAIPDMLDVYYDGNNIFSSGLVNWAGQFTVDYGQGLATSLMIVMNQGNPNPGTVWEYTPTIVPEPSSIIFCAIGIVVLAVFRPSRIKTHR